MQHECTAVVNIAAADGCTSLNTAYTNIKQYQCQVRLPTVYCLCSVNLSKYKGIQNKKGKYVFKSCERSRILYFFGTNGDPPIIVHITLYIHAYTR